MTKVFTLLVSLLSLTACSNRVIYDSMQKSEKQDCYILPVPQQDECLDSLSKRYDEYERERKELVE